MAIDSANAVAPVKGQRSTHICRAASWAWLTLSDGRVPWIAFAFGGAEGAHGIANVV